MRETQFTKNIFKQGGKRKKIKGSAQSLSLGLNKSRKWTQNQHSIVCNSD